MSENTPRRSDYARLLDRALRILAMRDHSEAELRRKLTAPAMTKSGPEKVEVSQQDIDKVVEWCSENRYLDDERFARQFIVSRSRKGYGPARIRQEMGQKGLSRELSESAMRSCEIDWCERARDQAQRKFGEPLPTQFAEKVKVQRFLLYRGYLLEDIQEIWRNFAD
jgi:regulatory protein